MNTEQNLRQAQTDPTAQPDAPKASAPQLSPAKEEAPLKVLTFDTAGRLTENEAIERFKRKFPRDSSKRILLPAQQKPKKDSDGRLTFPYIDVHSLNMPANEKYPNGMFCSFLLRAKDKTHMDHRGLIVAVKGSDTHMDQDGIHKIENTAIEIEFRTGVLLSTHAQSIDVARFLYQHPMRELMWDIDFHDPGGFWRLVGVVEEFVQTHTRLRKIG